MVELELHLKEHGEHHLVQGDITTIRELKLQIEECHHIPFHQQILAQKNKIIFHNGSELVDVIDIQKKIEVYTRLSPQKIKVDILNRKGDDISVEVASNATVLQLMMLIDERLGLSPHRQRLYTEISGLMHEQDVLDEYVIGKGPYYICLESVPIRKDEEHHLSIRLEKNGRLSKVHVEFSDSVYTLHGVARGKGLASGYKFYFVWEGVRLKGPNTFAFYGIPNRAKVQLVEVDESDRRDNGDLARGR